MPNSTRGVRHRGAVAATVFCAALLAIAAIAAAKPGNHHGGGHHHGGGGHHHGGHHHGGNYGGASRSSTLTTGFQEADFLTDNADLRTQVFDKAAQAHAGIARFNVSWREMTTGQPVDPTSPSDPAYHFAKLDAAVQDATARGIQPLIMIDHAPNYALGANPDPDGPHGDLEARSERRRAVRDGGCAALFGQLRRAAAGDLLPGLERAQPRRLPDPGARRRGHSGLPGPLPRHGQRLLRGDQERPRRQHRRDRRHGPVRGLLRKRPLAPAGLPADDALPAPRSQRADLQHADELRRPRPSPDQHRGRA